MNVSRCRCYAFQVKDWLIGHAVRTTRGRTDSCINRSVFVFIRTISIEVEDNITDHQTPEAAAY
jgi:hypothetical protein